MDFNDYCGSFYGNVQVGDIFRFKKYAASEENLVFIGHGYHGLHFITLDKFVDMSRQIDLDNDNCWEEHDFSNWVIKGEVTRIGNVFESQDIIKKRMEHAMKACKIAR